VLVDECAGEDMPGGHAGPQWHAEDLRDHLTALRPWQADGRWRSYSSKDKGTLPRPRIARVEDEDDETFDGVAGSEEVMFPEETWGERYFVTRTAAPDGHPVARQIRLFGKVDGTNLTYPAGVMPVGAPSQIGAGQVVDLGVAAEDFEIQGDHPFAVAAFSQAASLVDAMSFPRGGPAATTVAPVEQFRSGYAFVSPPGYDSNYIDVVAPSGAVVRLDSVTVPHSLFTPIGGSSFGVAHLLVVAGTSDAHFLDCDQPLGLQVEGYARAAGYAYPAGANLTILQQ
jgi:hypothetical protein